MRQIVLRAAYGRIARVRRRGMAVFALAMFAGAAAFAASTTPQRVSLDTLKSARVVLTLSTGTTERHFSIPEIEALGTYRVRTTTFWPADNGVYEGVLLSDLLRAVGQADAKGARVVALDGFSQTIPREDWTRWPLMVATRRNGKPMSRRQKGPLRIVYPRDTDEILTDQSYRLRWVWMIQKIEIVP